MKKTILTVLAALLAAVPAVQAQKVNKSALLAKIEKSDAEIADAKKSSKAATWINRGKAFYEAAAAPTNELYGNMESMVLKLAVGEPASTGEETLNGKTYETWVYPYFTAYLINGKVVAWKQTAWVVEDGARKAIEAYKKAYELDHKAANKTQEGLKQVSDFCAKTGDYSNELGEYAAAADAFILAFEAQDCAAYSGEANTLLLYYAGLLRTFDGVNNPQSFVLAAEYLNKALERGYLDEEGNIFYYLFHAYYGQKEADKANVLKAKDALLAGVDKFPKNDRIIEGLTQLYTSEEGIGDPADLIARIDSAIEADPTNIDLWFGRGRTFYALKNLDESIASFRKIAELKPDLYEGNYFLGLMLTIKAEELLKQINSVSHSSQAEYDADVEVVNDLHREALPWLEKAYELKPDDLGTLELVKQISFKLRDEEGMMEKYEKYNALFMQAKGE